MQEADWVEEKAVLLKSIQVKQERLKDYEKRFLPTTIDEEREVLKEKQLQREVDTLKSKIDTIKQEIEVVKLKKKLKELEDENFTLKIEGNY